MLELWDRCRICKTIEGLGCIQGMAVTTKATRVKSNASSRGGYSNGVLGGKSVLKPSSHSEVGLTVRCPNGVVIQTATRASCLLVHDTTQDMAILMTMSLELRVDRQCQSSCDEEDGCQVIREDFGLHDQTFCGTGSGENCRVSRAEDRGITSDLGAKRVTLLIISEVKECAEGEV